MNTNTSKGVLTACLVLCIAVISVNAFARDHWNRSMIRIKHQKSDTNHFGEIDIFGSFIYYNFGPLGEHAYLESCYFLFSEDKKHYKKLVKMEVKDQIKKKSSTFRLIEKLPGAKIKLKYSNLTESDYYLWSDDNDLDVAYNNVYDIGMFSMFWILPDNFKVKSMIIWGVWRINGLYCPDIIHGEKYIIDNPLALNSSGVTDSNQINLIAPSVEQPQNNGMKVYKDTDGVVINDAQKGEVIRVYTTAGSLINRTIASDNAVKINLPANQIYILNVGQARYKIAL